LPNGRSKWGQADIDGSVSEWVQDWWVASLSGECNDCANLQPAQERVYRGADYGNPPSALPTANPYNRGRSLDRNPGLGFRCARNVAKP
jgi:formylglycine-generating enzyme required for sulfatase activity